MVTHCNSALILAGGEGNRFGGSIPKQFVKIAGKTVIEHTLEIFQKCDLIDEIIVVVHKDYLGKLEDIVLINNYSKVKKIMIGGQSRQESSYIGLNGCDIRCKKVLIHDAVRPFLSVQIIRSCLQALDNYNAVDVAIPTADTIIQVNDARILTGIPKRANLMRGQTPQAFNLDIIKEAHNLARRSNEVDSDITDDCGLVLKYGLCDIYVIDGDDQNIKITNPTDIFLADKLFQLNSLMIETNEIKDLSGKVLVVFGHSSGIGKEIIELAQKNHAIVYGFSRSNGVDITSFEKIQSALDTVFKNESRIDYIVNTAGKLDVGKLTSLDFDEINSEVASNYLGAVYIVKCAIKYLEQTKGSIALFSSSSYTRGRAFYSIYSSTKAAIVNFVQAMAEELSNVEVRINAINPERTATPMRFKNFGNESSDSLLSPITVARYTLSTLTSDFTGQVIDVRRDSVNE